LYGVDFILVKQSSRASLHLGGGLVPSPRLIRDVLRDLLDVQVVINAPVMKNKRPGVSQISLHQLFDVRKNAVIPCYPPFSKLATKATALVPPPGSLAEAGLRAVYPDTSGIDLLLGKFSLEMCCRNTANLFWEHFARILC
jgi:hypothetical protein